MQIKKFLLMLWSVFAVSLPLYADLAYDRNITAEPEPKLGPELDYYHSTHEFYFPRFFSWSIDIILILYILIIVFAGCALLGACVLSWKKHEFNVPRQKKWYEWLLSIVILFAPYLILFPAGNPGRAASIVVLCAAVGLVYELAYTFVMNREGIRNGSLKHWASIEYLMIIACYSFVLLYRMLFFPGGGLLDWREEIFRGSLSCCFFTEYLIFWGMFFFFCLHRRKSRRYCYVLLHFCTVTGLISLITCFVFLFDGFTGMKVNEMKKLSEKPEVIEKRPPYHSRRGVPDTSASAYNRDRSR